MAPLLLLHSSISYPNHPIFPYKKRIKHSFFVRACRLTTDTTSQVGSGGPHHAQEVAQLDPIILEGDNRPSWKWRIVFSYDGTNYAGWQRQREPTTVQLLLEKALMTVTSLKTDELHLTAASRTDTGVHAHGQVAHFYTPFLLQELPGFHTSLNGLLPHDIRVKEMAAAHPDFHARYSAQRKLYQYRVVSGPVMDPFHRFYAFHVRYKLNINIMREAALYFVGEHNFSAFANLSRERAKRNFVRNIFRFDVIEKEDGLYFEVEGNGFFYKQVRNMVGLLLEIGKELVPPWAVHDILLSQDRRYLAKFAVTAPPHGLFLMNVTYDERVLVSPEGLPKRSLGNLQQFRKSNDERVLVPLEGLLKRSLGNLQQFRKRNLA